MNRFDIGNRVIVQHWKSSDFDAGMNGYYGHVVELHPRAPRPMVSVALQGRSGAPARDHDLDPDDPWIFYENELEHAD